MPAMMMLMKSAIDKLKTQLHQHPQWSKVLAISTKLFDCGYQCYLVGGAVRDLLLARIPPDLDLATNAKPDEVMAIFPKAIGVGIKFGVVRVSDIEVATFREEDQYFDGRRPEQILWSTPEKDVLRRDFTVNGLFFDLKSNQIFDVVGGLSDLEHRILKAIGDPKKRFLEDHLRILRGLRFSCLMDLQVEKKTWAAMLENMPLITRISIERITEELKKTSLKEAKLSLEIYQLAGALKLLFPFLSESDFSGFRQPQNWTEFLVQFLLYQEDSADLDQIFPHLLLSREEKRVLKSLRSLIKEHDNEQTPWEETVLFLKKHSLLEVFFLLQFSPQKASKKIFERIFIGIQKRGIDLQRLPEAFLRGEDVTPHVQGKEIQKILDACMLLQFSGKITSRAEALKWLGELFEHRRD